MSRPFDAAIVDLDGTLVDTLPDFVVVLDRTLDELGLPRVSRGFIERTIGKGSQHLIRRTIEEAGGDPALFDGAWAAYRRHYLAVNGDHAAVYPGAHEGLVRLRESGLRLACVTNKPLAFARPLLERKALLPLLDAVFGGDSFARRKPDPLPLFKACEALGSAAERTLMVGDSANDAAAARAAGCAVVLVRYGYNHGEPVERAGADALVDRIDAIDLGAIGAAQ